MKNSYPIYIVSKGRSENPKTAKMFIKDKLDFKILIEKEEYEEYKKTIPEKYIKILPFSNLGLGSYPARNFAWEDSIKNGYKRHWIFDDNIYRARIYKKGKKIPLSSGIALSAFNYDYFVVPSSSDKKPFYLNVHAYSCMLIKNDIPFRWRLKYNEDVDLCLQVLHNKYCTILLNSIMMEKTSTVSKQKGGNQDELYKNNAVEKKMLKSRSLQEVWGQYVEVKKRFNRPHHYVNWKKHFKQQLIRRTNIDWDEIKNKQYNFKLVDNS